jgi:hypothetical protein
VPTGTCLYDVTAVDPNHTGGEFWLNTMTMQGYVCTAGSWTATGSTPNRYVVKNHFEIKSGRDFTVSGNAFQDNWQQDQNGQSITFLQKAQSGPGVATDHLTFINNKITNVYALLTATSHCTGVSSGVMPCLVISSDNLIKNNLAVLGGIGYCVNLGNYCTGMNAIVWSGRGALQQTFDHNTIVAPDGVAGGPYYPASYLYEFTIGSPLLGDRMSFTNSIHSYDFVTNGSGGITAFSNNYINTIWNRMALIGASGTYTGSAGTGNTVANTVLPATTAAVGFVSAGTGDYHLSSSSPYSAANGSATLLASDGTDLGADVDAVNMAMSGAVAGTPPWDVKSGLKIITGSTKLVFSYQAPTTAACTATVYRALARISGNQVASVADSAANSITDLLTRQLYIAGLTASTHYWYKLVCGGGVIMVGDFSTRAAGSGLSQFTFDFSAATAMRYSPSASMTGAVSLPAATRQLIPVAADSVVYAQVGTAGPITILIAP